MSIFLIAWLIKKTCEISSYSNCSSEKYVQKNSCIVTFCCGTNLHNLILFSKQNLGLKQQKRIVPLYLTCCICIGFHHKITDDVVGLWGYYLHVHKYVWDVTLIICFILCGLPLKWKQYKRWKTGWDTGYHVHHGKSEIHEAFGRNAQQFILEQTRLSLRVVFFRNVCMNQYCSGGTLFK